MRELNGSGAFGAGPYRIALGGIHIECSTFTPAATGSLAFTALRGARLTARYPFLSDPEFASLHPVPLVHFRALPGGIVERRAYEDMKAELRVRLREAGPVDGVFLDLHGAMSVDGLDDAEADLAESLRGDVGERIPMVCAGDLHGNVSRRMVESCDAITAFRTAPHVDEQETRARAMRLLLRMLRERSRPIRVWISIPVLVSGEMSATTAEPGASLYRAVAEAAVEPGMWDASLWMGYPWADQPRAGACVVAQADETGAAVRAAEDLARRVWDARHAFRFQVPAGSAPWCIERGLADGGNGIFLSDAGDNPTAGGAGDVPETLRELIGHPALAGDASADAIYASLADPEAVSRCRAAGPGQAVTVQVGGRLDPVHGRPLELSGIVQSLRTDDPVGGDIAVLACGGVRAILTSRRKPFHRRADFLDLHLDPLRHRLTVVKIGYLEPELAAMARRHYLILSGGGVPPDVASLPYRRLDGPRFPQDPDFEWTPHPVVLPTPNRPA